MTGRGERCVTEDEIAAFVARFEACVLPRAEWTHHAHLLIAIWYLVHQPYDEALATVRRRIRAHNEAVGTPNTDTEGYHETLTQLHMRGVAATIAAMGDAPLERRREAVVRSPMGEKAWPLRFYSHELLFSAAARRAWVEPDLAPAPPAVDQR